MAENSGCKLHFLSSEIKREFAVIVEKFFPDLKDKHSQVWAKQSHNYRLTSDFLL